MPRSLLALILTLTATSLLAGNPPMPYLIKDLNPATDTQNSAPMSFTGLAAGNVVFLMTDIGLPALWCTDGTDVGTYRVYEETLNYDPWVTMAYSRGPSSVFFGFNDLPGGRLYTTDGTTPGTHFVKGVHFSGGAPCGDGRFCFAGANSEIGVSDGTSGGTSILLETASGPHNPWAYGMTTFGNRVFFDTFDDRFGECMIVDNSLGGVCGEMWVSDGTAAGTHLFKDLNPGPYPGAPYQFFTSSTGKLFFRALKPDTSGLCLVWGSDGTPDGTQPLRNDPSLICDPGPPFVEAGKKVYYVDDFGELMASDGTPETTTSVWPQQTVDSVKAWNLSTINDVVLVQGGGGLWATTGGPPVQLLSGTVRLLGKLTTIGRAYFSVGDQVWSTDGTPKGTQAVFRLPPFNGTYAAVVSTPSKFFFMNGGREMFVSDGTQSGTQRVRFETTSGASSTPHDFLRLGDRVLFTTDTPHRHYVTDGTAAGTTSLGEVLASSVDPMFVYEGHVYFRDNSSFRLWTTDGTEAGTKPVSDWLGVSDAVDPPAFLGQTAIFAAEENNLFTLMRRDGDSTPSSLALRQGYLGDFTSVGDHVVFRSWGPTTFDTLYVTDGTNDGTKALASHLQIEGTPMGFGNGALFASFNESALSLWTTDFTPNGTRALKSVSTQSGDKFIPLLVRQGIAFFAVGNPNLYWGSSHGNKVWRTDGTSEGTFVLGDRFLYAAPDASGVTLIRNTSDATWSWEVWRSDGTTAGTQMRYSGSGRLMTEPFTLPTGELAFAHMNGDNALDVRSIATNQATTFPLGDVSVGPMLYANGRLYFGASRGTTGLEPWAISLTGETPPVATAAVSVTYRGVAATIDGRAAIFTVTMSTTGASHPTVVASTVDGTLTAPADYAPFTKNIVFAGDHEVTLVVPLRTDRAGTLNIVLSSPANAMITQGLATATISVSGKHRAVGRH